MSTIVDPPVSPNDGATYVIGAGGTGAWTGHDGELARWSESIAEWQFYRNGRWISDDVAPTPLPPTGQTVPPDSVITTPPASPKSGDTYVVGVGATGAWEGRDGELTRWSVTHSTWLFYRNGDWYFGDTPTNPDPETFTPPIATTTTLGGVIVGDNLTIDPQTGRLSAAVDGFTYPPHNQSTPSDTWVIAHNLHRRANIRAYSVGGREMMAEIVHMSDDVSFIYFDNPVVGYATYM